MTDLTQWLESFAEAHRAQDNVASWVERIGVAIVEGVDDLPDDLRPMLVETVEQHWLAFLDRVSTEAEFELVPAARQLPVELARRHLGLPVLLRIYRVAQEASWEFAVEVVTNAPSELDHEALLVWFWGKAAQWFNSSVEKSVVLHQQEVSRIQQRGDAHRYEAVAGLLSGRAEDPTELSAALGGYPVSGSHIALIARAVTADSISSLEPSLMVLVGQIGRAPAVVVRPGGREVWAWVRSDELPELDPTGIDPCAVRVTTGGPAEAVEGFADAHRDAREAQSVALVEGRRQPLTCYDDVAALTLLAQDPRAAERFTRRVLRGLADGGAGKLRQTTRAALSTPGGAEAVATALGVHKNTVRYRVGQAERLLGHPLQTRAGDVLLALDYYDAFLGVVSESRR